MILCNITEYSIQIQNLTGLFTSRRPDCGDRSRLGNRDLRPKVKTINNINIQNFKIKTKFENVNVVSPME